MLRLFWSSRADQVDVVVRDQRLRVFEIGEVGERIPPRQLLPTLEQGDTHPWPLLHFAENLFTRRNEPFGQGNLLFSHTHEKSRALLPGALKQA
jgi:hypothetical protein